MQFYVFFWKRSYLEHPGAKKWVRQTSDFQKRIHSRIGFCFEGAISYAISKFIRRVLRNMVFFRQMAHHVALSSELPIALHRYYSHNNEPSIMFYEPQGAQHHVLRAITHTTLSPASCSTSYENGDGDENEVGDWGEYGNTDGHKRWNKTVTGWET